MLRKIFPFDAESSFFNSFKIVFIPEGYLASESAFFTASCIEFVNKLLETPPFNLTRINSNWLSVYTSFISSNNSGPSVNAIPSINRTAFESQVNTVTGLIAINQQKLNAHVDSETFHYADSILNLSDNVERDGPSYGRNGTLFVVLLPPLQGHSAGAEFENTPGNNDYYFVSTTQDGEWHQVVTRALSKLLGLGDEFESDGDIFLEPDDEKIRDLLAFPNIQYFETPPVAVTPESQWYDLFSITQRGLPIAIHNKVGLPASGDYTINTQLINYTRPEFWEGAGGYRTKVYRSNFDCLLRRQIGNSQLVVRQNRVDFCPTCLHFLKNIII